MQQLQEKRNQRILLIKINWKLKTKLRKGKKNNPVKKSKKLPVEFAKKGETARTKAKAEREEEQKRTTHVNKVRLIKK